MRSPPRASRFWENSPSTKPGAIQYWLVDIENLTLDLKSVQELVEAAAFVQDMNRARSIVRGARVRS